MKVYVSVDMEGISGIMLREQLFRGEALYEEARRLLTLEVNAVTEALVEAGATQIIVKDAHASGYNLLPELLHPAADYAMGATRIEHRFPGLTSDFAAALLIGYHAMGGTREAVRDHTMSSQGWQSVQLNGRMIGEIGLDALLFGLQGVPVCFVSGDDKTCKEAKEELGHVSVYATKTATGRHSAIIKPLARSHAELKEAVKAAVENVPARYQPYALPGPYEVTMRFHHTEQADSRRYDNVHSERIDGVTARYRHESLTDLLAMVF
ncbi:M55 family metallopeptidase [Paenibacillus sp. J5C_2022]|uniref:M55 family metallopeptidase n=1 Tax=Paenibacillus sp. J5C2022 TaxID=2977129 RepID=UPI0021D02277|nr:M55 family metallopeptidase [Paenibacillus sp. J5C2022]MCU6710664.1 M55 family metallopeptidase [Paenibacillus sp. J5C2022]